MQFLKKHYEKILLGIVVVLAIGAFAALPVIIGMEKSKLEGQRTNNRPKNIDLTPPDMGPENAALERSQAGMRWDLTKDHNTVNPVLWTKDARGVLRKNKPGQQSSGPTLLEVTAINKLYFRLQLIESSGANYQVGYTNEAIKGFRRSGSLLAKLNEKNNYFTLKSVVGPADSPTELHLEMNDTHTEAVIGPGKIFERIEGYAADFKYPPENNRIFRDQRKDMTLTLSGVNYKIIAITQTNVIISAPNGKNTPINFNAVP